MDRRSFLRRAALAGLVGASGMGARQLFAGEASGGAKAGRPNIILILSDDMGFSDIGCYGSEISTPNLDRLAAGGVRFTQFYNTARCCPTRASLLTGLHPHQTGIGHMQEDRGLEAYQGRLNRHCLTIAQVLKQAGYATYMAGKWHVTGHQYSPEGDTSNWPRQRGFDRFYGTLQGAGSFYDPATLTRDNTPISAHADPEYKPERYYYTDAITDNMVRFIEEHARDQADKPFFSYVSYTAAHWPMHALEEDIARYKGKYDGGYDAIRRKRFERLRELGIINSDCKLSPTVGNWEGCDFKAWEARCMEVYAAMIDRMDQGIGRIVESLRRTGQLDNTMIIFLQDNGGCAENMGRDDPKAWHLEGIEPMKPTDLQKKIWPPMRTRDGRPVLGGKDVMPGPDGTYIGYGENWANVSNTPFREYKHWVHEGGISTPLIVYWPAGIERGSRGKLRPQPGQLPDIMATCVAAAGASYPKTCEGNAICPMEGTSLLGALNADKPLEREALYWEHEGNRAVRVGDWKLVSRAMRNAMRWDKVEELDVTTWELYNIREDRSELNDVAAAHPDKVKELAALWQAWAKRCGVVPKPKR